MEKFVVLGASPNPLRHSHKVVKSLLRREKSVIAIGFRKGNISGVDIITGKPKLEKIDTLLLYLGSKRQEEFYDYIVGMEPKKIIFNPGTENSELKELAEEKGIEVIEGCALVMINAGQL